MDPKHLSNNIRSKQVVFKGLGGFYENGPQTGSQRRRRFLWNVATSYKKTKITLIEINIQLYSPGSHKSIDVNTN